MSMPRDKITVLTGGKKDDGGKGGGGSGKGTANDWRADITRTNSGKPESTLHNIMLLLQHDAYLDSMFYLDEFANRVMLTRDAPWPGGNQDEFTDLDGTELAAWVGSPHRYQLSAKRDAVMDCVEAISRRRAKHPVREYLHGVTWDGTPRLESMFVRLFGAIDKPYVRDCAKCFLVSAVSRILWTDPLVRHNGAQVDFMLVLEGAQGVRKTSAVRALFGPQWYAEAQESPSSKDFYQSLRGRWCVEIGEMDSFSKADVTKVKQAITSRFDTYRPSYGRVTRSFRRECVFVGTTNESEYLRDPTGGRRFLPVCVSGVDVEGVLKERDQLWAEAVQLYRDGFAWWQLPADAAVEQEERFTEDSWQGIIEKWLAGKAGEKAYPERVPLHPEPLQYTTTTELLGWALHIDVGKHGRPEQMRVAAIMQRIKWHHVRVRLDGDRRERRWVRELPGGGDDPPF